MNTRTCNPGSHLLMSSDEVLEGAHGPDREASKPNATSTGIVVLEFTKLLLTLNDVDNILSFSNKVLKSTRIQSFVKQLSSTHQTNTYKYTRGHSCLGEAGM